MKLRKTLGHVVGVKQLKARKVAIKEEELLEGEETFKSDENTIDYAFVQIVRTPTDLHPDFVKELELDKPDNVYVVRKDNLDFSGAYKEREGEPKLIFVQPHSLIGILDEEAKQYLVEFGGEELIVE